MIPGLVAALPINTTLYEESPVLEIGTTGSFRLEWPGGVIEAKQVIVCTNLYSEELGVSKHRIVPLATLASLVGR